MVECPECGKAFDSRTQLGGHASVHDGIKQEVECEWCGDTRMMFPSNAESTRTNFCDDECKHAYWKRNNEVRECWNCGEEHEVVSNRADAENWTCSWDCRQELWKEEWTGESHPRWNPDFDGYDREFYKIRRGILKRDGYKCKRCGMTQEEHEQKYDCGLTVHHINHDTSDNDYTNLVALCRDCNVWAQQVNQKANVNPQFELE